MNRKPPVSTKRSMVRSHTSTSRWSAGRARRNNSPATNLGSANFARDLRGVVVGHASNEIHDPTQPPLITLSLMVARVLLRPGQLHVAFLGEAQLIVIAQLAE